MIPGRFQGRLGALFQGRFRRRDRTCAGSERKSRVFSQNAGSAGIEMCSKHFNREKP